MLGCTNKWFVCEFCHLKFYDTGDDDNDDEVYVVLHWNGSSHTKLSEPVLTKFYKALWCPQATMNIIIQMFLKLSYLMAGLWYVCSTIWLVQHFTLHYRLHELTTPLSWVSKRVRCRGSDHFLVKRSHCFRSVRKWSIQEACLAQDSLT